MDELHTLAIAVAHRIVESGEASEHTELAKELLEEARNREVPSRREDAPVPTPPRLSRQA